MKNLIFYSIFFTIMIGNGCCDILCPCDDVDDLETAILLEDPGYDFSEGSQTSDSNLADGGIIGWCPVGQNPDYKSYDQWLWWRTSESDELQKDYGSVDLSTISQAPDTWDSVINPLLEGHCYVVKCKDGYVKFKVIDARVDKEQVEVEYLYSSTKNF